MITLKTLNQWLFLKYINDPIIYWDTVPLYVHFSYLHNSEINITPIWTKQENGGSEVNMAKAKQLKGQSMTPTQIWLQNLYS